MAATGPELRAMILAAGRGERLRPITDSVPKPLLRIGGKPLIDYALACVANAGIHDVVINLHHLGAMIRDHVGDGSRYGLDVSYSVEEILQDTGGGIRDARPYLDRSTFITMNADTLVDVNLRELAEAHWGAGATATMLLRKDARMKAFGLIETAKDRRVRRFLGRGPAAADERLEPWMYAGVQVLEPRIFDYLTGQGPFSITRESYPAMLEAGEKVFGQPFEGAWITVGTPAELAEAEALLSRIDRHGAHWTTHSVES